MKKFKKKGDTDNIQLNTHTFYSNPSSLVVIQNQLDNIFA